MRTTILVVLMLLVTTGANAQGERELEFLRRQLGAKGSVPVRQRIALAEQLKSTVARRGNPSVPVQLHHAGTRVVEQPTD